MNFCMILLYSSFAQCFFATANLKMCTLETPYRPIYTLEKCLMSQDLQKILDNMSPTKSCERKK